MVEKQLMLLVYQEQDLQLSVRFSSSTCCDVNTVGVLLPGEHMIDVVTLSSYMLSAHHGFSFVRNPNRSLDVIDVH